MFALPAAIPVTTRVLLSIVAAEGLELVQEPAAEINGIVMVLPSQTEDAPPIVPALGKGLTVTTCVAKVVPQKLVIR